MTSTQPDTAAERWRTPASDDVVTRVAAALQANGISVVRAANAVEAKQRVLDMVPDGAQVHSASSKSLELSGIAGEIEGSGRYEALRPRLWNMDRETEYDEIRRLNGAPDVMLGSVHAVTEAGSLVVASATGSQLGAYSIGAGKLILVIGTQKIVSDLDEALERVYEHAFPLEDARAMEAYGNHSGVFKILIINREWIPGRITAVFVDEPLGF